VKAGSAATLTQDSGGFLPPPPPAEKAAARQDQTGLLALADDLLIDVFAALRESEHGSSLQF
jgi:hypothetical protein